MKIKKKDNLKTIIDTLIKDTENLIIEKSHPKDSRIKSYCVLLKKNLKLATIIKLNPKNDEELVVSYYDNNVLCYDIITEQNILPITLYEKIKNRKNKINRILR